jgi:hypothetical protein
VCYNCDKNGHFITHYLYERKEEDKYKKKKFDKGYKKDKNMLRRNLMVKLMSVKNGTQVMRVLNWKVMTWQP